MEILTFETLSTCPPKMLCTSRLRDELNMIFACLDLSEYPKATNARERALAIMNELTYRNEREGDIH